MKAIIPAMAKDSRILISDMAIPEPVTPRDAGAIWLDLMMMTIGGKERTGRDWNHLAELSGLKLVHVWQEPDRFGPLCVVEYMLPDAEPTQPLHRAMMDGAADEEEMTPNMITSEGEPLTVSDVESSESKDVDWEERTVVGDREQSLEPPA